MRLIRAALAILVTWIYDGPSPSPSYHVNLASENGTTTVLTNASVNASVNANANVHAHDPPRTCRPRLLYRQFATGEVSSLDGCTEQVEHLQQLLVQASAQRSAADAAVRSADLRIGFVLAAAVIVMLLITLRVLLLTAVARACTRIRTRRRNRIHIVAPKVPDGMVSFPEYADMHGAISVMYENDPMKAVLFVRSVLGPGSKEVDFGELVKAKGIAQALDIAMNQAIGRIASDIMLHKVAKSKLEAVPKKAPRSIVWHKWINTKGRKVARQKDSPKGAWSIAVPLESCVRRQQRTPFIFKRM